MRHRTILLILWLAAGKDPPVELVEPLAALLSDAESPDLHRLRPPVFFALRKFGPTAGSAVPAVAGQWTLVDHPWSREQLIAILGALGPDAAEPRLTLLADKNAEIPYVRLG